MTSCSKQLHLVIHATSLDLNNLLNIALKGAETYKCKCTNHKLFLSFTGIQTNCLRKINQFGHGGGQKTQIYNLGYHR